MLELACHLILTGLLHQVGSDEKFCIMSLRQMITFILTNSTCSSACCEECLLPFQPNDATVINCTRRKQGAKHWEFSPAFYASYPRLTLCTTRYKAYCVYCRNCTRKNLLCLAKKGEDNFINTGFDNWKKARARFTQHSRCNVHKEAILKIDQLDSYT